jgi:hypothetical protein
MEVMTNTLIRAFRLSNPSPTSSTLAKFWDILKPNKKFRREERSAIGSTALSLNLFHRTWRCRLRLSSYTIASFQTRWEEMWIACSIKISSTQSPTTIMHLSWIGNLRKSGTMSLAIDPFSRKRWRQTGWRTSTQIHLLSRVNHQDSPWRTWDLFTWCQRTNMVTIME